MAEDGGESLDEVLDAFFPTQPAYVADEGRAVGESVVVTVNVSKSRK